MSPTNNWWWKCWVSKRSITRLRRYFNHIDIRPIASIIFVYLWVAGKQIPSLQAFQRRETSGEAKRAARRMERERERTDTEISEIFEKVSTLRYFRMVDHAIVLKSLPVLWSFTLGISSWCRQTYHLFKRPCWLIVFLFEFKSYGLQVAFVNVIPVGRHPFGKTVLTVITSQVLFTIDWAV